MKDKITFDELLNLELKYDKKNDREDFHLNVYKGKERIGVLINFEQCFADHCPISHSFNEGDNEKVANLFLNATAMYKLIAKLDTPEAKEIIESINNNPINFLDEDAEY